MMDLINPQPSDFDGQHDLVTGLMESDWQEVTSLDASTTKL